MPRCLLMVLLAVGYAALTGCTAPAQPPAQPPAGVAASAQPSAGVAAPAPATASAAGFNPTDLAWMQLADALHARALPLLEAARDRAGRPLAGLAERIGTAHEAGRGRLRALLTEAGVTGENPHAQHDMPGMPTAADLRALDVLRGDAFERRCTALLRAYLDQLVLVGNGERSAGGDARVRELAGEMVRDHTAELAELAELDRIAA